VAAVLAAVVAVPAAAAAAAAAEDAPLVPEALSHHNADEKAETGSTTLGTIYMLANCKWAV
jgi:hypothetical protein